MSILCAQSHGSVIHEQSQIMKRENLLPCFVFPMAVEASPFLKRLEVVSRKRTGGATYRTALFEGTHILVVRCGIGSSRAAASIRNLEHRPSWVMSVGTAGALVDSLRVGDIVVSSGVVCGEEAAPFYRADPAVMELASRASQRAGATFERGEIASVGAPVFTRKAREELHRRTGAIAVDMESYWIAQETSRLGVTFTALRVISDNMKAPPLPEYTELRALVRSPFGLIRRIPHYLRWRVFLRDFRGAINVLPPVLVEVLRCWNR